jgi:phosphohistidine phosphatase
VQSTALAPSATAKDFQDFLHTFGGKENVLLVGHNPNLAVFLSTLLVPAGAVLPRIRLRKGSIAHVTFNRGPATLQNLIDPRMVRAAYATSTKSSRRKTSKK